MDTNLSDFQSGIERSLFLLLSDPTPENNLKFYSDLQASSFIVPSLGKNSGLAIISAKDFVGGYIPAFTSESELGKSGPVDSMAKIVAYHTLKYMVVDDLRLGGIVINPFGKKLILHRAQIEGIDSVTQGMSAKRTEGSGKLSIAETSDCPSGLGEAISEKMKGRPEVYKVYITSSIREGDDAPHLMFAIDFDGRETQLFPYIAKIIQPFMRGGMNFELIKASLNLLTLIEAAQVQPVYTKGR